MSLTRHVRYTLNREISPTTPDGNVEIRYGSLGVDVPDGAILLPPCSPSKIVCVGRNYVDHAKELGNPVPVEPLLFFKPPSSLLGSGGAVVYPAISESVAFEGELGVVIGKRARHVPRERAFDYVRGYTCVNDITARDLQKKDLQFTRGKGFDTFCSVGPCMIDRDELELNGVRVQTTVNGTIRQDAPVSDMIFGVDVIIEYITQCMTLEPGDLIATGTPPGVGSLSPGDTIAVEVTGIGVLQNTIIRG
jgi:2-keto-4-pentenoate hydratase/2-oxohepta-3-ene-1,7-dioic acid hydratase in catechol pathway